MAFPPDPEEIKNNLLRFIRPPIPPWMFKGKKGEDEAWSVRTRKPRSSGFRWVGLYRIAWSETASGRGVIKVLLNERNIGNTSYLDRADRDRLVFLLESVILGGSGK